MAEPEIDRLEQLKLSLELSDGCLNMIRDLLVAVLGEEHMATVPPMFYPEAIQKAWVRKTLVLRGQFKRLREGVQDALGRVKTLLEGQGTGTEVLEQIQTLLDEARQVDEPGVGNGV